MYFAIFIPFQGSAPEYFIPFRFGFVTFEDIATAKKMLNKLNGAEVEGRMIDMRFAEERKSTPQSGGRGGSGRGGFRGRGESQACIHHACTHTHAQDTHISLIYVSYLLKVVVVEEGSEQVLKIRALFKSSKAKKSLLIMMTEPNFTTDFHDHNTSPISVFVPFSYLRVCLLTCIF